MYGMDSAYTFVTKWDWDMINNNHDSCVLPVRLHMQSFKVWCSKWLLWTHLVTMTIVANGLAHGLS